MSDEANPKRGGWVAARAGPSCLRRLLLRVREHWRLRRRLRVDTRDVAAPDGFPLRTYRLRRRKEKSVARGQVFFIQGSGMETVSRYRALLAPILPPGFEVILAERRGVGARRTDHGLWREHSSKGRRVEDHLAVLDASLRDGPVVLFGASEGGDVAASIAARRKSVSHLILWGVGGGWSQERELRHLLAGGTPIDEVCRPEDLDRKLEEIRAMPQSLALWAGLPYRRWSSFLWDPPLPDLEKLDIPIFLAHGARDRSVPVESARALAKAFARRGKTNLTYREYPDADHAFHHAVTDVSLLPLVQVDLCRWMVEHGLVGRELPARCGEDLLERPGG